MVISFRLFVFAFLCFTFSSPSYAVPPQYKATKNTVSLWAGTIVMLELVQKLENNSISVGNIVRLKVVEDVVINNKVLIRAGVAAYGRVRRIELCNNDNCTEIFIVAENVTAVDGQSVSLGGIEQSFRASLSQKKKKTYTASLVSATVLNTRQIGA